MITAIRKLLSFEAKPPGAGLLLSDECAGSVLIRDVNPEQGRKFRNTVSKEGWLRGLGNLRAHPN